MKKELRFKESDLEDSQHELKFHAIKNEELMDVINAFRSTSADRSHELMRAKAEQNSELIVQVQNLRDLLSKSGDQIADLQKELAQKSKEGEKLSSEQRTHQRLKVQIKGLVKTLNKIEIQSVDIPSEWINLQWITGGFNNKNEEDSDKTIQDITQKIISMEADRQRLLKESKLYNQTSEGDKEEQILELERKARKMQHDHDELQETNKSLMQQLANREKQVGALEDLFQSINANRKLEAAQAAEASPNRKNSLLNIDDEEDIEDEDDVESVDINSMADDATSGGITVSFEEMFTNIWSSFTGNSATEEVKTPAVENDKDQEISSCFNDSYHTKQVEEELRVASTVELSELKEQYQVLNKDYEAARYQIFDLCAKLEESTIKANSFETKAKMREGLLKDVIDQYKELQMENAASNDRMAQLKQKCATLLELEKERKEELKRREEAAADALAAAGKVLVKAPAPTGTDPPTITAMGETPTFEMSERTERMASDEESCVSSSPGFDKNFVIEENKALVSECDRLQHEFDSAIEKINELQKSLEEAQDERKEYQAKHANQSLTIAMLEGEKQTLQDKIVETTTMIVDEQSMNEHDKEEYKNSVLRETKAREKQIQREKELWDVIEQYRKLVDENRCIKEEKAEVEQQKAEVESELELTQKEKFQRRDLVYEYKKMEKGKKKRRIIPRSFY